MQKESAKQIYIQLLKTLRGRSLIASIEALRDREITFSASDQDRCIDYLIFLFRKYPELNQPLNMALVEDYIQKLPLPQNEEVAQYRKHT